MTDDAKDRLQAHGRNPVPSPDAVFVDRLESKLRAEHAALAPTGASRVRSFVPRLVAAAAVVVAGVVGIATLGDDGASVPVAVIDEDPSAPLDSADGAGDHEADRDDAGDGQGDLGEPNTAESDGSLGENAADVAPTPTSTPTATPMPTDQTQGPTPTAPPADTEPAATSDPPSPEPTTTVTPLPTATAAPLAATPTPTAVPPPPATAVPVPTPTPSAVPSSTPTVAPRPTPTPEREPAPIELSCEARVVGDAVGIVCNWTAPQVDRPITSYELSRSRNGSGVAIVSRQRAQAPTTFADRDVDFDEEVIYLVQGLDAEGVVIAASVREIVVVPSP